MMATNNRERIDIENVNHPGQRRPVDANMYNEVRRVFLKVLPKTSPGLTEVEIRERLIPQLSQKLFPQGAKGGWWTKAVQLDLEAKGLVERERTRPLRWHRT